MLVDGLIAVLYGLLRLMCFFCRVGACCRGRLRLSINDKEIIKNVMLTIFIMHLLYL